MHGFINSPALAKLIALQSIDEEINRGRRRRRTKRIPRLVVRRTSRQTARPATPRVKPTGVLAEDG
jgi:hypothetical protein